MIRFAVIGTNTITDKFLQAASALPDFKLCAVYSRTLARAREYAQKNNVSLVFDSLEALADSDQIDAVYIASPNFCHAAQSILMMQHHKHVLCEKPLAPTEAQAEESKPEEPRKDFGFVAVSIGQGMNDIFRELGVDYLIEGGQTMNPSTEDMLNAIEQVNAETVFILPNNKNIILAATQAQSLVEDKNVVIIPTTTVPQGISAIIGFDPEADAEENEDNMKDIIECVKTGEVTYAVRDTSINGITIKVDDIMGIDDDGIKKVGQDVEKVTLELLEEMVDEDSELISIYYGEDTTKEQAEALLEKVEETYGDCDVQLEYGGQPIYYFLLSVE